MSDVNKVLKPAMKKLNKTMKKVHRAGSKKITMEQGSNMHFNGYMSGADDEFKRLFKILKDELDLYKDDSKEQQVVIRLIIKFQETLTNES